MTGPPNVVVENFRSNVTVYRNVTEKYMYGMDKTQSELPLNIEKNDVSDV